MMSEVKQRIAQLNNGEIPSGYEKTEFGVFPCDWVTDKTLNRVCQINPKTNCLPNQFIYLDLGSVQDRKIIERNIIDCKNAPSRAQRVLSKNDILYQIVRPYQKNNLFFNVEDEQYQTVASTGYALIRSKMQSYLFQIIHADYFVNQVNAKCTGTNYPAINSDDLGKVFIAYPASTEEQSKIAEILMKWDEAIELEEQYIIILEVRKNSIMKRLLTPQDDWRYVLLGDICKIKTGRLDANAMDEDGTYPFFTCSKDIYRINQYSFDCEALLMAGNGDIGDVKYYNGKFDAYQRTYVLSEFTFNIKYVMQYLRLNFDKDVMKGMQKSSMPYIKLDLLKKAKIYYKVSAIESTVAILSAVDNEIELHQLKLSELKKQRKALQQYLLNGIVRV